jgi:hypothetical protein
MIQIKITSKISSILGKTDGINVFISGKKVQTLKVYKKYCNIEYCL